MIPVLIFVMLTGSIVHWKHRRETPQTLVLAEFGKCMDKECLADPEPRAEVMP
jgi:hypothetical protein